MAKVRTEEMFVCQFCGSLYEVGSKEDHTDFLHHLSCEDCEAENIAAFDQYWRDQMEENIRVVGEEAALYYFHNGERSFV